MIRPRPNHRVEKVANALTNVAREHLEDVLARPATVQHADQRLDDASHAGPGEQELVYAAFEDELVSRDWNDLQTLRVHRQTPCPTRPGRVPLAASAASRPTQRTARSYDADRSGDNRIDVSGGAATARRAAAARDVHIGRLQAAGG